MFYIVATPIGNLKDITFRAVEVLKTVDLILAEDTRHSAILLKTYAITAPMVPYQKFNERSMCDEVISKLKDGKNIALISDAGMPLISDPGSIVIGEIIKNNLEYTVLSGACAAVSAAVLSGLDLSSFCMVGFLPEKNIDRENLIKKFSNLECTLIFYISPHSIIQDLQFLFQSLGSRKASLAREISKMYEEVIHFTLGGEIEFKNKGEFVLVVEGAISQGEKLSDLTIIQHVNHYMTEGADKQTAIKQTARDRKVSKSIIYNECLKLEQ